MSSPHPLFLNSKLCFIPKVFCRIPNHQANTFFFINELNSILCEVTELQNTVEQKNNKMAVGRIKLIKLIFIELFGESSKNPGYFTVRLTVRGEGSGPSGSTPSTTFLRA